VNSHSPYQSTKRCYVPSVERETSQDQQTEIRRLKAELKRVTKECDIFKKAAAHFARTSDLGAHLSGNSSATMLYGGFVRLMDVLQPTALIPGKRFGLWVS
jgi:transposase